MKFSNYNIIQENENNEYILYNSFSKTSLKINEEYKQKFEMNDISLFNEQEIDLLYNNKFIIDDDKNEIEELEYLFNMSYFLKDPLNIVLVPTLKCNFSCPYCFEKVVSDNYNSNNYFDTLKKYAEKNFKNHAVVQLSLFGGEPLVMEKETLNFLQFAKEDSLKHGYDLKVSMVTNGSLLNDNNLSKLLEYGLFSLQITLDGNRESHNKTRCFKDGRPSFDLLIDKIKMVIKHIKNIPDFIFNLRINLNNNSKEALEEILNNFTREERSYMNLLIRVIYNTAKYQEDNKNSLSDLKQYYDIAIKSGAKLVKNTYYYQTCEACADSRFFYLMPDMTMWKCINDLTYTKAQIGKILEDGSVKINFDNIKAWYGLANCFKDEKCKTCKKLPDCFGGCILYHSKRAKRLCKTFDMACLPYCMR